MIRRGANSYAPVTIPKKPLKKTSPNRAATRERSGVGLGTAIALFFALIKREDFD